MDNNRNIPLDGVTSIENNEKKYTVINHNVVEDRGILSTKEMLVEKYKEILADPKKKEMFDKLTSKEKLNYLAREIYKDKKTYRLKQGVDQSLTSTKVEQATKNIADRKLNDSYSNQELGIIENNGIITTIEQTGSQLNINSNENVTNQPIQINSQSINEGQIYSVPQEQDYFKSNENYQANENISENPTNNFATQSISNETFLNPDQTEIINREIIFNTSQQDNQNFKQRNTDTFNNPNSTIMPDLYQQEQNNFTTSYENQQVAPPTFVNHKVRTLQPNHMNRNRIAGYVGFPIILTILILSTILGLIIGSIIALYK